MPKRKAESATSASHVAKRPKVSQIVINAAAMTDRSQTLSPLELLPTELFVDILGHASPASVLALKLTSRTILHKSKYSDGSDVVDLEAVLKSVGECQKRWIDFLFKEKRHRNTWGRILERTGAQERAYNDASDAYEADKETLSDYLAMRIQCEADTPKALLARLTCSICDISKSHGIEGFADCHFKPGRLNRKCLSCCLRHSSALTSKMNVCGKKTFQCWICDGLEYEESPTRQTVAEDLIERTTQYADDSKQVGCYGRGCQRCTNEMVRLCSEPLRLSSGDAIRRVRSESRGWK